ncbi:MAG TPA: hypothetical protein VJ924_04755 [Alphaproteobacteria bacterium]|nr:hypothetical protein [Alphaproteobacteria bacterium]
MNGDERCHDVAEQGRPQVLRSEADAEGLIPCYVRGCLTPSERRAFLHFLLRSPSLQRKVLDRLQIIRPGPEEFIERLAASPELQRRVLRRVQDELAAIDAIAPSCLGAKLRRARVAAAAMLARGFAVARESMRRWGVRLRARAVALAWLAAKPRAVAAMYLVCLVQGALIAALAPSPPSERLDYVALATPSSVDGRHLVRIADGASVSRLFELLGELGLEIVAGPDSMGLLELAGRPGAGAPDKEAQRARLRARSDLITIVEPQIP